MMFRTKTAEQAERIAAREGLRYGFPVFSDGWLVGTDEELEKAGCIVTMAPRGAVSGGNETKPIDHPPIGGCK